MDISTDGEVLARGNMIMEGYWEQPEATQASIPNDFFHTGDGGHIDEANYVTISDRKKDVIISGGENVSSIEVEDAIFNTLMLQRLRSSVSQMRSGVNSSLRSW